MVNDCKKIAERFVKQLLNDSNTIVKRLLKDC